MQADAPHTRIEDRGGSLLLVYVKKRAPEAREGTVFTTIKNLIPEPRQAEQPRHYVGKHRQPEPAPAPEPTPAPAPTAEENQPAGV